MRHFGFTYAADFDPRRDYQLTMVDSELTTIERAAVGAASVDDIELDR